MTIGPDRLRLVASGFSGSGINFVSGLDLVSGTRFVRDLFRLDNFGFCENFLRLRLFGETLDLGFVRILLLLLGFAGNLDVGQVLDSRDVIVGDPRDVIRSGTCRKQELLWSGGRRRGGGEPAACWVRALVGHLEKNKKMKVCVSSVSVETNQ